MPQVVQLLSQFKNKTKPIKGRERQSIWFFCAPPKIPQNAKPQTSTFHSAVMLLANPLCGALSQSSLWGCGCGCMSESASVQCCNTAGHRHLGNFPVKSQCVSIGYLGLLVFFYFSCPLPSSFISIYECRERGKRLGNAAGHPQAAGGAKPFPWQVEPAALSEIPGTQCPGPQGREALPLGPAVVTRGPFNVL